MIFEFSLEKNKMIPVYYLDLVCNDKYKVHTCLDTGAGVSNIYLSNELLNSLFLPNIKKTSHRIGVNLADGSINGFPALMQRVSN